MRWHIVPHGITHHELKSWEAHALIGVGALAIVAMLVGLFVSGRM
jgi:hypothetical protein